MTAEQERTEINSADVLPCWSCKGPVAAMALFCETCEAVQPPRPVDAFARFGLEPSFDIEIASLEPLYFNLQRRLHPDRFVSKGPKERALSQSQAASLNKDFETLKDPVSRATALLEKGGHFIHPEGCNTVSDPVLLMEVMETREALGEAETPEEIARIESRAHRDMETCLEELSGAFAANDLDVADRLNTRLKYLVKLEDEVRARKFAPKAMA